MLKVIKGFKFAYRGIDVKEYAVLDEIPDGDACEKVALEEKWVKRVKKKAAPEGKAPPAKEPDDAGDAGGDGGALDLGDGGDGDKG